MCAAFFFKDPAAEECRLGPSQGKRGIDETFWFDGFLERCHRDFCWEIIIHNQYISIYCRDWKIEIRIMNILLNYLYHKYDNTQLTWLKYQHGFAESMILFISPSVNPLNIQEFASNITSSFANGPPLVGTSKALLDSEDWFKNNMRMASWLPGMEKAILWMHCAIVLRHGPLKAMPKRESTLSET